MSLDSNFLNQYAASGRFRNGAPRSFSITDSGVYFLQSDGPFDPVLQLKRLDPATSEIESLFDPKTSLVAHQDIPEAEKARRERLREAGQGITAYSASTDGRYITFALNGSLVVVDALTQTNQIPSYQGVVDPRITSDGRTIACVIEDAVWIIPTLSPDLGYQISPIDGNKWGISDFLSAEEFGRSQGIWWSPNGEQLLAQFTNDDQVSEIHLGNPAEPTAGAKTIKYPFAGTNNPKIGLRVFSAKDVSQSITWDTENFPYLSTAGWVSNSAIYAVVLSRSQQELHVLNFDLQGSASVAEILNSPTWVESNPQLHAVTETSRLNVLDDFSNNARRLFKNGVAISSPELYVRRICYSNENFVIFEATSDSACNQVFKLDSDEITQLTHGENYSTVLAASESALLTSTTSFDSEPKYQFVTEAATVNIPDFSLAPRIPLNLKKLSQTKQNRVVVLLPEKFKGPLPVIMAPYGGPHAQLVTANSRKYALDQWFADQGFAVIVADGPGSIGVNPEWEHTIYKDFAKSLEFQLSALAQADAELPGTLDLNRVGIRGWSFGGYLAALATMVRPDIFKAAVAGAPVTSWELYDSAYTERYLGNPKDEIETYQKNSLLTLTPKQIGKLLIVHGLADDNVLSAHSLQLSTHLINLGLVHQFLPLSNVTHMTPQHSVTSTLLTMELDFFNQHLKN